MSIKDLSRRQFLKSSLIGSSMLLTIQLPALTGSSDNRSKAEGWCVYVKIDADNRVSIFSPVAEMGQHMKTTGPMILADEMDVDWRLVSIAKDCSTYLHRDSQGRIAYTFADMNTGGSHAVRRNWDYLRHAGAAIRRMMIEEAAAIWEVPANDVSTHMSFVTNNKTDKKLSYGQLSKGAASRHIDMHKLKLKARSEYTIIGRDVRTVDIKSIVTGQPLFGIDEDYPNALQVLIHRAPWYGASVVSFDRSAALAVPGVKDVVEIERSLDNPGKDTEVQIISAGVAVIADTLWAALQGKRLLNTQWQENPNYAQQSSGLQQTQFKQMVEGDYAAKATLSKDFGDVLGVLSRANNSLDHTYETPLFAHACMEPLNCIADIREHDATIVVGHQFPIDVALEVERFTGIDALNVEIINKRMGGGFGRRYKQDFIREAVLLSKNVKQPVKITWTREDAMERDFFGPAHAMRVRAALDDNNDVEAWHHIQAQTQSSPRDACFPANIVKNYRTEVINTGSKIPTGPWRGPGHLQWTFAVESMTDELAYHTAQDPLAFRLNMLLPHKAYAYSGWGATVIDSGRMAICYERAAKMAEWGKSLPKNHGLGIAGHFTFGSYAAFVIEVEIDPQNQLTLHNAWGAIDCGLAINPNHIRSQMEGGFIEGLNAALFNSVKIEKGRVINNNFHTLRWIKMREAPPSIEVDIINNDYPPTGVGEPPTAPAAAALANAIFAASGQRIRRLPISESVRI